MTRCKAKASGLAPSPLAGTPDVSFVDLGIDDATTPPAQVVLITVPPTPTVTPADEAAIASHNVHSVTPAHKATTTAPRDHSTPPGSRGKMKLQFCIDREVALLEERLHVYELLDQYLKEENVMLKERVTKLDQQLEYIKSHKTFLSKRVRKWYDEF